MISPVFKSFLQTERNQCNQLFASLRHQHPQIDAEGFQQFLIQQLDPVVALLDDAGQSVGNFAMAGYQHGLDLAAKRWLGKSELADQVNQLWRDVIPQAIHWVLSNPHYWLNILANVLYRLHAHDSDSASRWMSLMKQSTKECQSAEEFKKLGLIAAWLAGLACYRQTALTALSEISDKLFSSISQTDFKHRTQIQQPLINNRWLDFSSTMPDNQPKTLSLQKRFGNSTILDGEFTEPPKVLAYNNQLYVTSANQLWLLFFDNFGEMLIPTQELPSAIHYQQDTRDLNEKLKLYFNMGLKNKLPDLASLASCAELDDSLALTSKDSFAVILFNR
jgi:hypothetical protein